VELLELWSAFRRRLWLIILMMIIAGGSAASLSKWYLPKIYAASVTLMVIPSPSAGTDYISTLVAGQQMVATYATLATNTHVLTTATASVPGAPSVPSLTKNVSATADSGTNLMTLTVKAKRPLLAALLSNSIARTLVSTVTHVTGQSGIKVVAYAVPKFTPVSPRLSRTTGMGAGLGLIFGVLIAFIWNSLDDAIRAEEDLQQTLQFPVLGVISTIPEVRHTTTRKRSAESTARRQRSVSS